MSTKKRIGDNYGSSCQDCGQTLEGYGYGGWFGQNLSGHETCHHGAWYKISDTEEECIYCHVVRERSSLSANSTSPRDTNSQSKH